MMCESYYLASLFTEGTFHAEPHVRFTPKKPIPQDDDDFWTNCPYYDNYYDTEY